MLGRGEVIEGCVLSSFFGRFKKIAELQCTYMVDCKAIRLRSFVSSISPHQCTHRWEECIPLMSVGQHCIINCPPEVCYGEQVVLPSFVTDPPLAHLLTFTHTCRCQGITPVIPPSSSFEFDIQLISFRPVGRLLVSWTCIL